jgi:hypothetical protein
MFSDGFFYISNSIIILGAETLDILGHMVPALH